MRLQAELIVSGSSYKDAVQGTEFDDLDPDTAKEMKEAERRLTLLREDALEDYLVEKG